MMHQSKLAESLRRYGVDMYGVNERFMGDIELYEKCFRALLSEPSFPALERAMATRDYPAAFHAAHALKGLAGNLGLTPFDDAVYTLVESLRARTYGNIDAEYAVVRREFNRLGSLLSGEPMQERATAGQERPTGGGAKKKPLRMPSKGRLILWAVTALLFVTALVALLFFNLTKNYRDSIAIESASHLEEINRQIKLYIEGEIETDWRVAYSVRSSFLHNVRDNDAENIRAFLSEARDIWGVDDIILYSADGAGVGTDGQKMPNDEASSTMYRAATHGEYVSIVQSTISYTLPIRSNLRLNGERIVALSVVRNLESFLDDMAFSSFDGAAHVYLTQSGGGIISRLTHPDAAVTYNIMSVFEDADLTCLTEPEHSKEELLYTERTLTCRMRTGPSMSW